MNIRKCSETDIVSVGAFYDKVVLWLTNTSITRSGFTVFTRQRGRFGKRRGWENSTSAWIQIKLSAPLS